MSRNFTFMFKLFIFISVVYFSSSTPLVRQLQEEGVFEVVVLQHNTVPSNSKYPVEMKDRFISLFTELNKLSPGSRFGYGVFNDWPERSGNSMCKSYKYVYGLTPLDVSALGNQISSSFTQPITIRTGGSGLLAIALAAKDPSFSWWTRDTVPTGKKAQKVIILSTRTSSLQREDEHNMSAAVEVTDEALVAKYKGTTPVGYFRMGREKTLVHKLEFDNHGAEDERNHSPSLEMIKSILNQKDIKLLIVNDSDDSNVSDYWDTALRRMDFDPSRQLMTKGASTAAFTEIVSAEILKAFRPKPVYVRREDPEPVL